jgi:hypothetical protein
MDLLIAFLNSHKTNPKSARAALHALSSFLVAAGPTKDSAAPWSNPSATSGLLLNQSSGDNLHAVANKLVSESIIENVFDIMIITVHDKTTSSPRQQHSVATVDPAATQLLYGILKLDHNSGRILEKIAKKLNSDSVPPLAQAAVSSNTSSRVYASDIISQCQCCALVAACCTDRKSSWISPDFARSVANWLSTSNLNSWLFAYGLDMLMKMVRVIGPGSPGSRLRGSLSALASVAVNAGIKFYYDYTKEDDWRRIQVKMNGYLSQGPLDGYWTLLSVVNDDLINKRFLRGLSGISGGGIRKLISITSFSGLMDLTDILVDCCLTDLLAVLQSVVAVTQLQLVNSQEGSRRFQQLLDSLLLQISADEKTIDSLSSGNFIPGLVNAMAEFDSGSSGLAVLSALTQTSQSAVQNVVSAKVLELMATNKYLESPDEKILEESLSLISNIARSGSSFYPAIHEKLSPYDDLVMLLHRASSNVKSKVCSLVGNMARHSAFFYVHLTPLVPLLDSACRDQDSSCRKFASFAIGNLAFHSAALYGELRAVIPILVTLLQDEDEKTRANSAGALGNFVRNSSVLVSSMMAAGALEALLAAACCSPMDSSGRIALFSLGNLAMHPASKEALKSICNGRIDRIVSQARQNKDGQTVKYCDRLLNKLGS